MKSRCYSIWVFKSFISLTLSHYYYFLLDFFLQTFFFPYSLVSQISWSLIYSSHSFAFSLRYFLLTVAQCRKPLIYIISSFDFLMSKIHLTNSAGMSLNTRRRASVVIPISPYSSISIELIRVSISYLFSSNSTKFSSI